MAGKLAGAGGGKRGGYSTNSEPNVIPFIDIMLVLLIIFMVAAPKPSVDIKVDLPPPNPPPQKIESQDKPTIVALQENAGVLEYFVEGEKVELVDLEKTLLRVAQQRNPDLMRTKGLGGVFSEGKIFVEADQKTEYNNVIELINEVDTIGFKKVSLVAQEADF